LRRLANLANPGLQKREICDEPSAQFIDPVVYI